MPIISGRFSVSFFFILLTISCILGKNGTLCKQICSFSDKLKNGRSGEFLSYDMAGVGRFLSWTRLQEGKADHRSIPILHDFTVCDAMFNSCKKKCGACWKRTCISNIQHTVVFIISLNYASKHFSYV